MPSYRYTYSHDILSQIGHMEVEVVFGSLGSPRVYLDAWIKRLWKIADIGQNLQHLKVVPKHLNLGARARREVRTIFKDENVVAQLDLGS